MISGSPDLPGLISILFMNLPERYLAVVFIGGGGGLRPPTPGRCVSKRMYIILNVQLNEKKASNRIFFNTIFLDRFIMDKLL